MTLRDIYTALGQPSLLAMRNRTKAPALPRGAGSEHRPGTGLPRCGGAAALPSRRSDSGHAERQFSSSPRYPWRASPSGACSCVMTQSSSAGASPDCPQPYISRGRGDRSASSTRDLPATASRPSLMASSRTMAVSRAPYLRPPARRLRHIPRRLSSRGKHQRGGQPDGFSITLATGDVLESARLVLAFGISDELPAIPGLAERWGTSVLHCPYCHGYEFSGSIGRAVHLAHVDSPGDADCRMGTDDALSERRARAG